MDPLSSPRSMAPPSALPPMPTSPPAASAASPPRIIQYHPSQITIEKQPARKALFCQPRGRGITPAGEDGSMPLRVGGTGVIKPPLPLPKLNMAHLNTSTGDTGSLSERGSVIMSDSDFSDNLSVVSDLSDLSVMSSLPSFSIGLRGAAHGGHIVPGVHGNGGSGSASVASSGRHGGSGSSERRVKSLSKRVAFLQSEKESFERQLTLSSSQKCELSKVKERCFELTRENVNLKSQVESLQNLQKSLVGMSSAGPAAAAAAASSSSATEQQQQLLLQQTQSEVVSMHEFRSQLRKAHDEIFRLQNEDARSKLELRVKAKEIETIKISVCRASEENHALRVVNKGLEEKAGALGSSLEHLRAVTSQEGNQLALLQSDVSSATKSRDWYSEQLVAAKGQRSEAQDELVAMRREISTKNLTVRDLRGQVEELENRLKEEKQKYASEKEDFTHKLKKIESEMSDQESQLDQIQTEKDAMISDLSDRLDESEDISCLSENVRDLESDLKAVKCALEAKDAELEKSRTARKEAEKKVKEFQEEFDDLKQKLSVSVAKEKTLSKSASGLETDLSNWKKLVQGSQDELERGEKELEEMRLARDGLEQTLDLVQMELEDKKEEMKESDGRVEQLEKRVEQLEMELLEQHQLMDDLHAENLAKKKENTEAKTKIAQLKEKQKQFANVEKEREAAKTQIGRLEEDLDIMTAKFNQKRTPSPEPDVKDLQGENQELRKKVLQLEQFENEVLDLRLEQEELAEAKSALSCKLLEAEKMFLEDEEKLRSMVIQRDELIESMKADMEGVERDLGETRHLLDETSTERERATSEQSRKVEDLEEALEEYGMTRKQLMEKQQSLFESQDRLQMLSEENEALVEQLHKACARVEQLEVEGARLKHALEDSLAAEEEWKELQAGRIARLEAFITEYEKEIVLLSTDKGQLQAQIIALEDANGKLSSECLLNDSLREQIATLQRDLKKDTSLRQELAKSIEAARLNMDREILSLESALASEKDLHNRTRQELNAVEIESLDLRQEVSVGKLKSDDVAQENYLLQTKVRSLEDKLAQAELSPSAATSATSPTGLSTKDLKIKELEHLLDENKRSMCSMEDHISTLKFHVQQKAAEVEEARAALKAAQEKHESGVERMRDVQEGLKAEAAGNTQANAALRDERDGYRNQVTEMNLALRKSLSHIKDLRSKASHPTSPLPLDADFPWAELQSRTATTYSSPRGTSGNLSNLQNCLASLKAEMTVLQSKLAPSATKSRPESRVGSAHASPEKTRGEQL